MKDCTDIALINTHTKGDGRHHNRLIRGHKPILDRLPLLILHSGMIGFGRKSLLGKQSGHLHGGLLEGDIDDGRSAYPAYHVRFLRLPESIHQSLIWIFSRFKEQGEVGSIESGLDAVSVSNSKALSDIRCHLGRCCRGQAQHRRHGKGFDQFCQFEVVRTEIMAPFGDTMGLVNHQ